MVDCEFCKKSFNSIYSLKLHQNKTKKCLNIQQSLGKIINIVEYKCIDCNKIFIQKKHLDCHSDICKEKKQKEEILFDKEHQKEIDLLKQQHQQELQQNKKENDSLKQQLEMMTKKYDELVNKLAEKSTTTINSTNRNTYNHGNNYAFQMMFEKLPEFNEENIRNDFHQKVSCQTFKNLDRFVADHSKLISPYILVFDESRGKIGIKEEGVQPKDMDSEQIVCKTMKIVKSAAEGLVFDEMEKAKEQTSILNVAENMKKLNTMNNFIANSSNGISDKMTKRIGKEICKKGLHTNLIKN